VARPGRAYIVEKRGIERRPVRASQDTARTGERHAQLHVRGRDAAALHAIEYRGSQELDVRGVSPHERGVAEEDRVEALVFRIAAVSPEVQQAKGERVRVLFCGHPVEAVIEQ